MKEKYEYLCSCGEGFNCQQEAKDHDFLIGHEIEW